MGVNSPPPTNSLPPGEGGAAFYCIRNEDCKTSPVLNFRHGVGQEPSSGLSPLPFPSPAWEGRGGVHHPHRASPFQGKDAVLVLFARKGIDVPSHILRPPSPPELVGGGTVFPSEASIPPRGGRRLFTAL